MNAFEVLAGLVLEDGRRWGEAATDVQVADAQAWLEAPEPYHFCTRARGYSKTQDAAAADLAELVTGPPELRAFWLAADRDQGALALESIEGFARRTSALHGLVEVQASRVVAQSGATLTVLPADAPGSWGLRPDRLTIDELAQWREGESSRRLLDAGTTALTKRPGARAKVITTAGQPRGMAWDLIEHARRSDLWRVSETAGPPPWADADRLEEQRQRLPGAIFDQLHGNRWVETSGDFLEASVLQAALRLDGPCVRREQGRHGFVAALDLGHVNDRTAFALVHRQDGEVRLDLLRTWQGGRGAPVSFDEVGLFVRDLHREFGFELFVDPWQALSTVERLRKSGVRVREYHFSAQSKMRLASTLLHALNTGGLALYSAEGLREELLALRVKQTGAGLFAFDHAPGEHDDRAVALAMALVGLLDRPSGDVKVVSYMPSPDLPVIEEGGLSLRGDQYVDLEPRRHPRT